MATTKTKRAPKRATKTTRIGFVIDESGSMSGTERSVTDGYNEFVATLTREAPDLERVFGSLAFFDAHGTEPKVRFVREGVALAEMPELAEGDYRPRGMTPLNDAVSEMIGHLGGAAKAEDQVMLVIVTDGHENASETSTTALRQMVMEREAAGWEFIYLGANVDAFAEARNIGMSGKAGSTYAFTSSRVGTSNAMRRAASQGSTYTSSGSEVLAAASAATPKSIAEDPEEFKKQQEQFEAARAKAEAEAGEKARGKANEAATGVFKKE